MDDLALLRRCKENNKGAWDEFNAKFSRLIYSYIYHVLKTKGVAAWQGDAQEIFHGFLAFLMDDDCRRLRKFKGRNGCSLSTWIRLLTVNFTIDYVRRLKGLRSIDEENEESLALKDALKDNSENVRDLLNRAETLEALKECIERLDLEAKYFLELHFNKGVKLKDLARHLEISRGAVDVRKASIVKRLKDCFKTKGFALDL